MTYWKPPDQFNSYDPWIGETKVFMSSVESNETPLIVLKEWPATHPFSGVIYLHMIYMLDDILDMLVDPYRTIPLFLPLIDLLGDNLRRSRLLCLRLGCRLTGSSTCVDWDLVFGLQRKRRWWKKFARAFQKAFSNMAPFASCFFALVFGFSPESQGVLTVEKII